MTRSAPQVSAALRLFAAAGLAALAAAGCQGRGAADLTGSVPGPLQATPAAWRQEADILAPRFEANPSDPDLALRYARALRALDRKPDAAAVLQQAAMRNPSHAGLLPAHASALAGAGRYKEAMQALDGAYVPERPDWRLLSAQGALADQMGDHRKARGFYEAALELVPGEPTVLSNLGLSHALVNRLPEAERLLRRAAEHPRAGERIRQNLALVLSLQGKFGDAERVLGRDLRPDATASTTTMKGVTARAGGSEAIKPARHRSTAKPRSIPGRRGECSAGNPPEAGTAA